jgi:hypothetical protein
MPACSADQTRPEPPDGVELAPHQQLPTQGPGDANDALDADAAGLQM